jgi:plasmid stabilization system protein ParE
MTHPIIVRPEAEADIIAARNWYSAQRPTLSDEFLAAVDAAFSKIAAHPEAHAVGYKQVRSTLLKRFPYVVYSRFAENQVTILAVLHGSRHPRAWQQRT